MAKSHRSTRLRVRFSWRTLTRFPMKYSTISGAELSIARLSGVAEVTDSCSIFAPASTRARTTLSWPEFAAWWRAVHLNWSSKCTLALNRVISGSFSRTIPTRIAAETASSPDHHWLQRPSEWSCRTDLEYPRALLQSTLVSMKWSQWESPTWFQGVEQSVQIAAMSCERRRLALRDVKTRYVPALWTWMNWGWMGSME